MLHAWTASPTTWNSCGHAPMAARIHGDGNGRAGIGAVVTAGQRVAGGDRCRSISGTTSQSEHAVRVSGHGTMQPALVVIAVLLTLGGDLPSVCRGSCVLDNKTYICTSVPQSFPTGVTSLVLLVSNVGEINSTVFASEALASVFSLIMVNAGITAIYPRALYSFRQLRRLTLYQNDLSRITSTWLSQPDLLENLILHENSLQFLDENMLEGFSGLRSLGLSRNKIRTIAAESFRTQGNLIHLDLSGNELIYINPEAFRVLHSTRFRLYHNPWDCSCRAEDFVLLIRELANASRLERETEVICATPVQLKEQPVRNVTKCLLPSPPAPNVGEPPQSTLPTLTGLLVPLCILVLGSCLLFVLCRRKWDTKQVKPKGDPEALTENRCLEPGVPPTGAQGLDALTAPELCRSSLVRARASSAGPVLSTTELLCIKSRTRNPVDPGCVPGLTRMEIKDTRKGLHANLSEGQKAAQHLEVGTLTSGAKETPSVFEDPVEPVCLQHPNPGIMEKCAPVWETTTRVDQITEKSLASEAADNLPYLSIGTEPARQSPEAPENHHGNKDVFRRVIRRISTWPPTSFQWKKKDACKSEANHLYPRPVDKSERRHDKKEDADCFEQADFFFGSRISGFWENMGGTTPESDADEPSGSSSCPVPAANKSEDKATTTSRRDLFQPPKQTEPAVLQAGQGPGSCEMDRRRGPDSRPQKPSKNRKDKRAEQGQEKDKRKTRRTHSSGGHEEGNVDPQRGSAVLGHDARGSPADENLLQDNEYAFIDLLHEVVQNQGRWTRDRWKRTHLNKQRGKQ